MNTSPPASPPPSAPAPPRADPAVLLERLQALAEPTRLQIVERLAGGECCVCDLQGALDAAQSRLSFHLKKLKEAGILEDRREGRWAYYSLVPGALDEVMEGLGSLRSGGLGGRAGDEGGCGCGEGCGCG
jgi:ArsR family transcriptional regulator, arsenate/arsenite/antimonite-responsive transcriptional repressor